MHPDIFLFSVFSLFLSFFLVSPHSSSLFLSFVSLPRSLARSLARLLARALYLSLTHIKNEAPETTPVGFEPTWRGDIGLAG